MTRGPAKVAYGLLVRTLYGYPSSTVSRRLVRTVVDKAGSNPARSTVFVSVFLGVKVMHYRNGRPAKNGDEIVSLESGSGKINGVGVLIRAVPGNDFCNGIIANDRTGSFVGAVLCDCLHVDDVAVLLAGQSLDKRPDGK